MLIFYVLLSQWTPLADAVVEKLSPIRNCIWKERQLHRSKVHERFFTPILYLGTICQLHSLKEHLKHTPLYFDLTEMENLNDLGDCLNTEIVCTLAGLGYSEGSDYYKSPDCLGRLQSGYIS